MRLGLIVSALFCSTGLLGQRAAQGPSAPVAHSGIGIQLSRSFSSPSRTPGPAVVAPNRSGHWPSWDYGAGVQSRPNHPRERYPYVYPGLLSFGYGLPVGLTGDQGEVSAPPVQGPEPPVAESAPPLYRPLYTGSSEAPVAVSSAKPQPVTTLIFKDGRPERQVRNYALIGASLWALDDEKREEIAVAELDVAATVKANRSAGVDFALPGSR